MGLIGLGLVVLELAKRGMPGMGRVFRPVHVEVRVRPRGIHLDVHVGLVDDDGGRKMGGLDPAPVGLVVIVVVDGLVIDLAGRVVPVGIVGDVGVLIGGPRTEMERAGGKEHGQGKGQPSAEDRVFHKASLKSLMVPPPGCWRSDRNDSKGFGRAWESEPEVPQRKPARVPTLSVGLASNPDGNFDPVPFILRPGGPRAPTAPPKAARDFGFAADKYPVILAEFGFDPDDKILPGLEKDQESILVVHEREAFNG